MKIQLLYFDGCPNLEPARVALAEALAAEHVDAEVEEIDITAADAPEWARGWGSPTILIDGAELTGASPGGGTSCRLYPGGAPSVETLRARIRASTPPPAASRASAALPMFGAITAALAASACCVVPAALAIVGLSSTSLGIALAPYRLFFLIATGLTVAVGFWLVYRKQRDACGCEVPRSRRVARIAMWITAVAVTALAAYPLTGSGQATAGSATAPAAATLRLTIKGMDCPECTDTIANRIKKVPGVVSAAVDYKNGTASVRHDGRAGIEAASIAAVVDAGFAAQVAP